MQKIAYGAEAILYKDDDYIIKERVKKSYRISAMDENIREKRTRLEARLLREARRAGVMAPHVLQENKFSIRMEFIDGMKIKDILDASDLGNICKKMGKCIAIIHRYNIIHGDLTTSNMILKNNDIYFIDFGLGFFSHRIEDKATDLHLLHEALESTHYSVSEPAWQCILNAYTQNYEDADKVIKTLSKIEKRGRYTERS